MPRSLFTVLPKLITDYPGIALIALNGGRAEQLFKTYLRALLPRRLSALALPSTSSIPGRQTKSFEEKVKGGGRSRDSVIDPTRFCMRPCVATSC
jgi:hypothetical protein